MTSEYAVNTRFVLERVQKADGAKPHNCLIECHKNVPRGFDSKLCQSIHIRVTTAGILTVWACVSIRIVPGGTHAELLYALVRVAVAHLLSFFRLHIEER